MSILHTFVALDLETTGLDPAEAEILEMGAVKVESGKITDRFQTYVKPERGIPEEIVRLTGITEMAVQKAPRIETALQNFRSFITDLPLVAYHGRFEERFLSATSSAPFTSNLHSLRDLARAALPTFIDHRAETLAAHFGTTSETPHKALKDAEELAGTFLGVLNVLREAPLRLKQQMLQLLQGTRSGLLPILVELGNESVRKEFLNRKPGGGADILQAFFNVGGEEVHALEGGVHTPLDLDTIQAMLEPGGLFEKKIDGYEFRQEQVAMARAVGEAANHGRLLVVEAGTGVGKSIAYLLPSILYAVQNQARVVVSTNTKNLQEQLFFKDLPALEIILDMPFRYALLKGRSNYICLNRWGAALTNLEAVFTEDERIGALPLVLWAEQTETGDINENTGFDMSRNAGLWAKVCSDSGFCRSQRCRNNGRCHANNIRRSAQKAHVVVVNHSLLFSDIASENAILGEYTHLVLDEAHNVEKIAAHYLGRELNIWRVKNLSEHLRSPGFSGTGTLPAMQHWMSVANLENDTLKAFDTGIKIAMDAAEKLWLSAQIFFQDLTEQMQQTGSSRKAYTEKIRYRPKEPTFDGLAESLGSFAEAIASLGSRLKNLADWLRDIPENAFPNQDELRNELDGRIEDCQGLLDDLDYLTSAEDEGAVYWMELPGRDGSADTRLFAVPLSVADVLHDALYDKMETITFTSASLGIRGKLTYFLRRMGLESLPEGRVQTLCLGSPFDYENQALVCAPGFMPSPKSPEFQGAVDSLLSDLAINARRGTLALFTSYSMLNRTYNAIKTELKSSGILLLGQGIDGSRTSITDRFKLEERAVLLGTDSFWEGIDVPGEALQILGIVRLPFAVPSEPIVAAHMEELEKQGKDPFLHYSVPEAILKFRQGFGRLIRKKTDRGAVIVMDSRVLSTRYGQAFLEALPVAHQTFQSSQELIGAIQTWFEQTSSTNGKKGRSKNS
ncbi:MAG: exonuclease domain-containing protein [bacterium]|nr:exonuclease domain-containing protein [bacterium]